MLLVASCWVPCDGLAVHPRGEVMLRVASCWVPSDGLAFHPGGGGVVTLLVTSRFMPLTETGIKRRSGVFGSSGLDTSLYLTSSFRKSQLPIQQTKNELTDLFVFLSLSLQSVHKLFHNKLHFVQEFLVSAVHVHKG